ncbi:MAG TPA: hypothetical protein DCX53_16275 [Anaerolineae bacterium]|nr:hypothetical protein [Anaerolineae bacterium]
MNYKYYILIIPIASLISSSCSVKVQTESSATAAPSIITATLPLTPTPLPSETPLPPVPQPTIVPVSGTTSTQLNVRAEPSTASEVIDIIPANSAVQIVGKDVGENWWQIIYASGADGKGWVTAQFVETAGKPDVPVIGGDGSNPLAGNMALVIQQLNVRSGPGTSFDPLGVLNENDVVSLTGRNRDGSWLQIDFPIGPEGKGWVSSGFVRSDEAESLPIVLDTGTVIGTSTPARTPLTPTPTIVPASMDFDTPEKPIKTVILGGTGTHTVLYNGDVSYPEGDTTDWISVTPRVDVLFARVECLGDSSIRIKVSGSEIELACNSAIQVIPVSKNVPFLIQIQAVGSANQLQYTRYMLEIKANP